MIAAPLLWLLAIVAGALIPVQAAANATLSKTLSGNVAVSALVLFLIAGLTGLVVVVATGGPAPTATAFRAAPLWSYLGGVIVAFYVLTITFLVPRIGVGAAIALIVTGQILAALTIDHFGLLRALQFPLTVPRLAGAGLMIAGAFLALKR